MSESNGQPHRGVRVAEIWNQLSAAVTRRVERLGHSALDIVDVGGGSGIFAVPLAQQGHRVTVVDPSPNALATLRQRAGADLVTAVQGDAASLTDVVAGDGADVVICHGVLEVVDDPAAALAGLRAVLRPDGLASLVAAQRHAAALGKAIGGHLDEARYLLDDPEGRWGATDPLPRRFDEAQLTGLLVEAGFTVDEVHGVRVFTDLVPGALVDDPSDVRALAALEARAAAMPEMRALAAALHVLARSA